MNLLSYVRSPDGSNVSRTQKTLALSLASMVNTVLQLLLSMLSVRLMSKEEIAINSQTMLAYHAVAPILLLGLSNGLYYYLSKQEHRRRAVLRESLLIITITSLIFAGFLLLGGNIVLARQFHNDALCYTLYWMIPYALALSASSVLSCIFVFENRLRFNAVYSVGQTMITLLVVGTVTYLARNGTAMVVAYSVCGSLFALCSTVLVFRYVLPKSEEQGSRMRWSSMKALLAVSIPLGISSMVGTLSTNLDKLIISSMLTPAIYAVYTQGARELPLIGTITGAINTVMIVDLTKAAKDRDYKTAISLFHKTAEYTSMFLMPIMVFCLAAAPDIITFLYTDAYLDAVPVFRIYLLYMPIRVVLYGPLLIALGKSRFVLARTILSLFFNAGLSYILVRFLGAEGAALATIVSVYMIDITLNLWVISRTIKRPMHTLLPVAQIGTYAMYSLPGGVVCLLIQKLMPSVTSIVLLAVQGSLFCVILIPIYKHHFRITWKEMTQRVKIILKLT